MTVLSPVSTFLQPNYSGDQPGSSQTGTGYPLAIDAAIRTLTREGDMFAAHQATSPNMTVMLDPGHVWAGTVLTEVGVQTSGTITAPIVNPRIDRAVIDRLTGLVSLVTGAENVSPSAPAIPAGAVPIAQIALQISTLAITNSMISDERDFTALGNVPGAFGPQTALASAATTNLGTVASQNVQVTGTITITSFGSSAHINAPLYLVKFSGALTLTYNATSLILPGAANIIAAAGDAALMEYLGSGNWRCQGYFLASGKAVVSPLSFVSVKRQVFVASATYAPSAGMLYCDVEIVSGGGGGGGGGVKAASSSNVCFAGGGQGGGYLKARFSAATIGVSQSVTIGAGGAAGAATGTNGGNGGTSSLGSLASIAGGLGGSGSTSSNAHDYNLGGSGAPTATGTYDYIIPGTPGGAGYGNGTSQNANASGYGGGPMLYGTTSPGVSPTSGSTVSPAPVIGYGSGSPGAASIGTSTGAASVPGSAGIVIITEYCSQ